MLGLLAISYVAILAVYQAFAKGEIHETVEHYRVTPSIFSTLALAVSLFFNVVFELCPFSTVTQLRYFLINDMGRCFY